LPFRAGSDRRFDDVAEEVFKIERGLMETDRRNQTRGVRPVHQEWKKNIKGRFRFSIGHYYL